MSFAFLLTTIMAGITLFFADAVQANTKLMAKDTNLTYMASTFYRNQIGSVDTDAIDLYKIYLCGGSLAGYTQAQLSIILSNNPTWDTNKAVVVVEISKCEEKFDENCVFSTNYAWGSTPTLYNTIVWDMNNVTLNNSWIYIRFTAYGDEVQYTYELSFVNDTTPPAGVGYDSRAFHGVTKASAGDYTGVLEYVRSSGYHTVPNNQRYYFYVYFCKENFPSNDVFSITISTISAPNDTFSAMTLYGCAATGNINDCTEYDYIDHDSRATSYAQITLTNGEDNVDLTQGMYVLTNGKGGERNNVNQFLLQADVAFS